MIRDFLTLSIVSLTLFGSGPQRDGDSLGLQIIAATGDVRRTQSRFLVLHAGLMAGAQQTLAAAEIHAGWNDLGAEA